MREELKALALHRLERAREAFAEGDQLLTAGSARGAVNRLYYAAFYAARALLATREVDSSKHSGVIALFQRRFVKTSLVDADTARILARTFAKRQMTDYADFTGIDVEEAREIRAKVATFVEECARVLDHLAATGND